MEYGNSLSFFHKLRASKVRLMPHIQAFLRSKAVDYAKRSHLVSFDSQLLPYFYFRLSLQDTPVEDC